MDKCFVDRITKRERGPGSSADEDWYARYSYESLLMQQPHIAFGGLWRAGDWHYVLCPEPVSSLAALDGKPLTTWFEDNCRILCAAVRLVDALPQGAQPVPDRAPSDLAKLSGFPFTVPELITRLAVVLPRGIVTYSVRHEPPNLIFEVPKPLAPHEISALKGAVGAMDIPLRPVVVVCPRERAGPRRRTATARDLTLLPARFLPAAVSRNVRKLAEEDEELWLRVCEKVLGGGSVARGAVLPKRARETVSRCVVDSSVGQGQNLRIYLTAFRQVVLGLPLAEHLGTALRDLQVTEADLIALAERKRLLFLLPHSLERYDAALLARLADQAPESLILSRRLAAITVLEVRKRAPLLYPPWTVGDRAVFARVLLKLEGDRQLGVLARILREELTRTWRDAPFMLNFQGATAVPWFGLGPVVAGLHRAHTREDVALEIVSASRSVEWAAALHAVSVPPGQGATQEQALQELCASAYSGVQPLARRPVSFSRLEVVVEGLLGLDSDMPVLEFADALAGNDVAILNRAITGRLTPCDTPEAIAEEVAALNREVRRFERNAKRYRVLDLVGLLGALYSLAEPTAVGRFVPLAGWVAGKAVAAAPRIPGPLGKTFTWLQARATSVKSEAVVVSRLRQKL